MTSTDPSDPLAPAPGRHPFPLGQGWTAVLLQIVPGGPVAAVGLFRHGELEDVLDEPGEVRRLVGALQQRAAPHRGAAARGGSLR